MFEAALSEAFGTLSRFCLDMNGPIYPCGYAQTLSAEIHKIQNNMRPHQQLRNFLVCGAVDGRSALGRTARPVRGAARRARRSGTKGPLAMFSFGLGSRVSAALRTGSAKKVTHAAHRWSGYGAPYSCWTCPVLVTGPVSLLRSGRCWAGGLIARGLGSGVRLHGQ